MELSKYRFYEKGHGYFIGATIGYKAKNKMTISVRLL
jgi:hypothetical protein